MAKGINKTISIGNLCADPELRRMPNGDAVTNVRLAMNDSYKDKNTGETVDKTEYMGIVFFRKLAEIVAEYCKKGSKIYVEGSLHTRKWQDKNGNDRFTTEIKGLTMQMLDSRGGGSASFDGGSRPAQNSAPSSPAPSAAPHPDNDMDDDIPFANPLKYMGLLV